MAGILRALAATAALLVPSALLAQTQCPLPSPSRSVLTWTLGDAHGRVSGLILNIWTERPPAEATVWLHPASDSTRATVIEVSDARGTRRFLQWTDAPLFATRVDSTGRFAIERVPAGQYFIDVLAGGMGAYVQDTVSVGGSGLRIVAVLASGRQPHTCSLPAVSPPHNDAWY